MQELLGQTPIFCKTLTQMDHFTVARVVLACSTLSQKVHKNGHRKKPPCSTTISCNYVAAVGSSHSVDFTLPLSTTSCISKH